MSTGKSAWRAAMALAVVMCTIAVATFADESDPPPASLAGLSNSVVVESQILMVGIPGSTVGVFVSNSDPIAGLAIPLEIRPVTPGPSIAQTIDFVMNPTGRIATSPLGFADDVDSLWPEATRVLYKTCVTCSVACTGPVSNSYCVIDDTCISPVGPYGLFFGSVSTGDPRIGELIELVPGADPGTTADASLQIILNQIGTTPGFFEIDTACWAPSNRLLFAFAGPAAVQPDFTKGTIEIRCDCSCHADPICDGITNIQDVVKTIDVAFRAQALPAQPFCPRAQTDVNCDGLTTIQDVVAVIEVAFRAGDPGTFFCSACAI